MEFQVPSIYFVIISPVLIVAGWGMLLMLLEFFIPEERKGWYTWLSMVGIILAFVQTVALWGFEGGTFTPAGGHPMVVVDNFANFLNLMLMGIAKGPILRFLALELLSIPLYIMSGLAWPSPESEESAMKYFLLGAFSSGVFVFGIALTYGATGSTALIP